MTSPQPTPNPYQNPVPSRADLLGRCREDTARAAAPAKASAEDREATARRDWLLAGAPLRCGLCGGDIDPTYEDWRVCGGLAEHGDCHLDDEDEYQAYLEERTRTGPRPGDIVRFTYSDGFTVEGVWVDDPQPAVRLDDGTLHRPVTGQVRREVVELGEDLP